MTGLPPAARARMEELAATRPAYRALLDRIDRGEGPALPPAQPIAAGPADAAPIADPGDPGPTLPGWAPCGHRSARWSCGGEWITGCALGLGQAGLVDRHDCAACPRIAPPATPDIPRE